MKKTKIVVTGGAGFIGTNLVRALNELGEERVVIVDHLGDNPQKCKVFRLS